MLPAVRRHMRRVTVGLIVTLAAMTSVECVPAEDWTAAEMACCAAMDHHCGAMAQTQDCCSTAAPRVDQGSAVTRISLAAPHVTAVQLPAAVPTSHPGIPRAVSYFIGFQPKPPGVPTYLLISTFRI